MIAAVSMANGRPLYTCNARDFGGVDALKVVPVAIPAEQPDSRER